MASSLLAFALNAANKANNDLVAAKLIAAEPKIMLNNRLMITAMLEAVKADLEPQTPLGPGHFGAHLKDSYKIVVNSTGTSTVGALAAPPQGYWREFGTRGRFHKGKVGAVTSRPALVAAFGGGGEKAGMFAHHALSAVRKFIAFYYGTSNWYHL